MIALCKNGVLANAVVNLSNKYLGIQFFFCGSHKDYSTLSDSGLENAAVHSQQECTSTAVLACCNCAHFVEFCCLKEHNLALQFTNRDSKRIQSTDMEFQRCLQTVVINVVY